MFCKIFGGHQLFPCYRRVHKTSTSKYNWFLAQMQSICLCKSDWNGTIKEVTILFNFLSLTIRKYWASGQIQKYKQNRVNILYKTYIKNKKNSAGKWYLKKRETWNVLGFFVTFLFCYNKLDCLLQNSNQILLDSIMF